MDADAAATITNASTAERGLRWLLTEAVHM